MAVGHTSTERSEDAVPGPPAEHPDLVRLVSPDGAYSPDHRFPFELDEQHTRRLYRLMALARGLNAQALTLQRQGQLGLHLSGRGQEAAQVGSASALRDGDWVFPQGRELAAAITRGLTAEQILHVWRGTWFTHHDVTATRFAPYTMPIATQLPHAVGVAMGAHLAGDDTVVLAYIGDGGTSEGDFHEAVNFAAVYDAPCVIFVQNNQWSISVPLRQQTRAPTLAHKGAGYGIPAVRVDGQDVVACHAVTRWAVARARAGLGPSLIEAVTYRLDGHSTSDDPSRYQPATEVALWESLDPLDRARRFLEQRSWWDADFDRAVQADVTSARRRLREAIFEAPAPDPEEIFAHVYADLPEHLAEQREQLQAELRRGQAGDR